jgi:hypothetical protein
MRESAEQQNEDDEPRERTKTADFINVSPKRTSMLTTVVEQLNLENSAYENNASQMDLSGREEVTPRDFSTFASPSPNRSQSINEKSTKP